MRAERLLFPCMALGAFLAIGLSGAACAQGRTARVALESPDGISRRLVLLSGDASAASGLLKAPGKSTGSPIAEYAFPESAGLPGQGWLELAFDSSGIGAASLELILSKDREDGGASEERLSFNLPLSSRPVIFSMPVAIGRRPLRARFFASGPGSISLGGFRLGGGEGFSGYAREGDALRLSPGLSVGKSASGRSVISLPLSQPGLYVAEMDFGGASLGRGLPLLSGPGLGSGIEMLASGLPVSVPFYAHEEGSLSLTLSDIDACRSFTLRRQGEGPISSDPGRILSWERRDFRAAGFEAFRWDAFPDILILLCEDYAIQDRLLKRLAFFVEKAGFRGRLAGDAEISGLHGWNAHDYRSEDLARFFEAARAQSFPLGGAELGLRTLLESQGVIKKEGGGWKAGTGALLSVSLETEKGMRRRFMAHEGMHGLYFTQEKFREGVQRIWAGVEPDMRRYVMEFFDFKELDVSDPDLMANEFGAYFLQTPVDQTPGYFMGSVADFLEKDRGGDGRYRGFAASRKSEFRDLSAALDGLVESEYGLGAGRTWRTAAR